MNNPELVAGETLSNTRIILEYIQLIDRRTKHMATTAVTRDQLDTLIDGVITAVNTGFTDLQAKIAAGTVTTPEDFSAEAAKLQSLIQSAASADPGPTSIPATPVSEPSVGTV